LLLTSLKSYIENTLRIVFIWGDNIQEGAGILHIEIDKESTLKSEKITPAINLG